MCAFLCVCACVAVWEPAPSRLCDDVTGAFQGPLRVGRTVWRDCCFFTPDWVMARVFLQRLFFCSLYVWCASHQLIRSARSIETFYKCKRLCIMYTRHKHIFKSLSLFLSPTLFLSLSLLPASCPSLNNVLELEKGRKWLGLIINNDIHRSQSKRCGMGRPLLAYFRPQSLDE